jgi:hypothetical protein
MSLFSIIKYSHCEEEHQKQHDMCGHAYSEVDDTSQINRESTTPHKRQNHHDKHSAGRVRYVSQWISTGVKNVLVGVIDPESKFFHVKSFGCMEWPNECTGAHRSWIRAETLIYDCVVEEGYRQVTALLQVVRQALVFYSSAEPEHFNREERAPVTKLG